MTEPPRAHAAVAVLAGLCVVLAAASCAGESARTSPAAYDFEAVCLAVEDLQRTFGETYAIGETELEFLRLARAEAAAVRELAQAGDVEAAAKLESWNTLARKALLANPLLDFDRLLIVRRSVKHLGLPQNWEGNSSLPLSGFDNALVSLSPLDGGELTPYYEPGRDVFVGDVCLHWDAARLLFSMPGANGRWQVHELTLEDGRVRELPLCPEPDVDNYDACYLPDGAVIFGSTASFTGVPCVTGSSHVSNLYRYDPDDGAIRRLTFEQDHNWSPRVLHNGRILYQRWEYSDIPHFVSRLLFHANPDGTGQMEYYGSNSYWPNALFYARPVPGHPTQVAAIVSGHHGVARQGELVLFDPALGRREAAGVVQRIPGRGKPVEPVIKDQLVDDSWPKFLHPWPLSSNYFLVSAKPAPFALWGVYLVDVFDNMTLLKEVRGQALFEPVPLRRTPRPPVIPSRVDLARNDALVLVSDVYAGPGLAGVPRGTVKQLRLYTYHYSYHGVGGQVNRVGLDGPWDIKRVMGTVPVEPDGSAYFRVPANTPISVQPLDGQGQAVQLMRSWMTAMPGETLSCTGCHESQNTPPPVRQGAAMRRPPSDITPWHGPERGFSFRREVQPVLDHYCIDCHDGADANLPDFRDGPDVHAPAPDKAYREGSRFPPGYLALRRYVRTPTMESDMHLLPPMEFHASTSELVRRLRAGHHGVELDGESWDRLVTWIDLHAPAHGTWHEIVGMERVAHQRDRRRAMQARYEGGERSDPEAVLQLTPLAGVPPAPAREPVVRAAMEYGPSPEAAPGAPPESRKLDLGGGVCLRLVLVPAGTFIIGEEGGPPNERPAGRVEIAEPFWMGATEVTNAQFALFDPRHDSRLEHGDFLQFSVEERGWPLNAPDQPVVRVTWREAMAFCEWLGGRTGESFTLPDEAQWEYACRAGTRTPLWYGPEATSFAGLENLADAAYAGVENLEPWHLPAGAIHPWRPADGHVEDGYRVSAPAGTFAPNGFGLRDMHGNVAEWTRTIYRPYPYAAADGRNDPGADGARVVRGGAWSERPGRARSAARRAYASWQGVYNVGFRVVSAGPPAADAGTQRLVTRSNGAFPSCSGPGPG